MTARNVPAAVEAGLRLTDDDGGSLIVRRARRNHACEGNGAALNGRHAPACPGMIAAGSYYLECLWSAPGFQSGSRHCAACAVAFFPEWVAPPPAEVSGV